MTTTEDRDTRRTTTATSRSMNGDPAGRRLDGSALEAVTGGVTVSLGILPVNPDGR